MNRVVVVVAGVAVLSGGLVVTEPGGAVGASARSGPSVAVVAGARAAGAGAVEGGTAEAGLAGSGLAGGAAARKPADALETEIVWTPCGSAPMECATLRVPLDYAEPSGRQITLALNRIRGAGGQGHLGSLLVNPGGPGASGRSLAAYVATALPRDVKDRFDVIGFDPRGVGASVPAISCVDARRYYTAPRPDNVPRDRADEARLVDRAREYANGCAGRWAWFLPHLTTANVARDMDAIRRALGEEKISYLGYSYGTYLGSVYASLFPERVRRLVLDSIVDSAAVWYKANIAQDFAFDRRHREFLGWVARNHATYRLGRSRSALIVAWRSMRNRLREQPAGGVVGPSELDDIYTVGGYTNAVWPRLAQAFSDYARNGETEGLVAAYRAEEGDAVRTENSYAVYLGVQCRDAAWPRDWAQWRADTRAVHFQAPFLAWPNAVYNAPCAFWSVPGGAPVPVGTGQLPPVLLLQSRRDPATPYAGALRERRLFPTASLVAEQGGNHGVGLAGNPCVDRHLAAYLKDGVVPPRLTGPARQGRGPDATCPGLAEPRPPVRSSAEPSSTRSATQVATGRRRLRLTRLLLGR